MPIVSTDQSLDRTEGETHALPATLRVMLFIVIMSSQVTQSAVFGVISPAMAEMARSFGPANGTSIAQLLFALPSLGILVVGLFSGWVLERIGLRPLLIWSMIAFGAAGGVPAITTSVPLILASRLILGISCVLLSTCCTVLLVLSYQGAARSRAMGYQSGIGALGGVVTILAAGLVAHSFGWHMTFLIYTVGAWLVAVCAILAVHPPANAVLDDAIEAESEVSGGVLAAVKLLWPVYIAACLLFTLPMANGAALPFLLAEHGLAAGFEQSVVLSAFSTFAGIGALSFGFVRERVGSRTTFGLGLLLSFIGMVLIGISHATILTFAGSGITGLGLGFYFPHLWMVVTTVAPPRLRGRAAGVLTSAMYLGGFTSPGILAILEHGFGIAGTFSVLGATCLVALAAMLVTKRNILTGAVAVPAGAGAPHG